MVPSIDARRTLARQGGARTRTSRPRPASPRNQRRRTHDLRARDRDRHGVRDRRRPPRSRCDRPHPHRRPRHPRRFGCSHAVAAPALEERSSTRSATGSPTRRSSSVSPGSSPPRIRACAVLVMAVLALSMLITYERARAESLGLTARGGLMERAERMVLLGIGLAFDILVPVMWVMLVLTAFTAVQRFVKVWRQATPEHSRRPRHLRGGVGRRAASRDARAVVGGAPSGPSAARRPARLRDPSQLTVAPRGAYLAYRAGAEVARRVPAPVGEPMARGLAQLVGVGFMRCAHSSGRAQPPAYLRAGVRRHRPPPRRRRDLRLLRAVLLRALPPPGHSEGVDRRAHAGERCGAHRRRHRRGQGVSCSRCRTSGTGTPPVRGWRVRGTRSRSSPNRSNRRSSSTGSSTRVASSVCVSSRCRRLPAAEVLRATSCQPRGVPAL